MNSKKSYIFGALLVVLVLVAGYLGVKLPEPNIPEPLYSLEPMPGALAATSLTVGATPVALQVGALAAGARMVCGSTQVTGTTTLPTGLATPQYVNLSLAQDVTADCAKLSYTNAAGVVTAKCWTSSATPAAATTPAAVNWCAIGK